MVEKKTRIETLAGFNPRTILIQIDSKNLQLTLLKDRNLVEKATTT